MLHQVEVTRRLIEVNGKKESERRVVPPPRIYTEKERSARGKVNHSCSPRPPFPVHTESTPRLSIAMEELGSPSHGI